MVLETLESCEVFQFRLHVQNQDRFTGKFLVGDFILIKIRDSKPKITSRLSLVHIIYGVFAREVSFYYPITAAWVKGCPKFAHSRNKSITG